MSEEPAGAAPVDAMTSAEEQLWRSVVGLTIRLPAEVEFRLHQGAGITHIEYRILSVLAAQPERRLRVGVLAGEVDASLSRTSHVLARMQRRGWITRRPVSRQGVAVILTESGHRRFLEITPAYVGIARDLVLDALGPSQVRALHTLCAELLINLDATQLRAR